MPKHSVKVREREIFRQYREQPRYYAKCSCRWESQDYLHERLAERDGKEHLKDKGETGR